MRNQQATQVLFELSKPGRRATRMPASDVPTEFVSYSVWDNEDSIRRYLESDDYHKIRAENREKGATHVTVRLYERV